MPTLLPNMTPEKKLLDIIHVRLEDVTLLPPARASEAVHALLEDWNEGKLGD